MLQEHESERMKMSLHTFFAILQRRIESLIRADGRFTAHEIIG